MAEKPKRITKPAKTQPTEDLAVRLETALENGLPSPEILAKYEKIVPGGAARLFELAEIRAKQARDLERKAFETKALLAKFKQIAYFLLALIAGVFGGILLINGSELAGLIVVLVDGAVIASGVIYGKSE